MSIGLHLKDPTAADVRTLARSAEAAGFSHLTLPELSIISDGPATGRDPLVASAIALEVTTTLRVGTAVVGTIFHPSHHLALAAATLNEQSDGRFILGVGVAHREFAERVGVSFPDRLLDHARDACVSLRRYSAGGVEFGSGFPVWLAALGPGMVRTAVESADGTILNWVSSAACEPVAAMARRSGRPWTLAVMVRVGPRIELAADVDRYRTMFGNYAAHFERQSLGDAASVVAATCLPTEELDRLPELADAYAQAGVDVLVLNPSGLDRAGIEGIVQSVARLAAT